MNFEFFNAERELLGAASLRGLDGDTTYAIDRSLLQRAGHKLIIKTRIPITDIHGYWTPELLRPHLSTDWCIRFNCAINRDFPYLTFFRLDQRNRFTFGLTDLEDDAAVAAQMNQQNAEYEIEFTVTLSPETAPFVLFADAGDDAWPAVLARYRELVRPQGPPAYPAAAWQPVYCTWYAIHAAFNLAWLDAAESAAAELGFGTFIVDDGWCIDVCKRVTPETLGTWYDRIGDWQVSERKLPNFRQHVQKAQQRGLKYLLWVSPFMVGTDSQRYRENPGVYLNDASEGYRVFDPANAKIAGESMNALLDLAETYGLDGLKVDFIDAVPPSLEAPHGRAVLVYLRGLVAGLRRQKPDAMIEIRQRYTTPGMLDLATQFRALDAPLDLVENFSRIAHIRMILGDRVPVHADPAYWHPDETEVNVSRHLMAACAGVPMLSMDLPKLSDVHRRIVKAWLNFYREHLDTFRQGHWELRFNGDHVAALAVTGKQERIVWIADSAALNGGLESYSGALHLLNLSGQPLPLSAGQVYDWFGQTQAGVAIPCGGRALRDETKE